MSAHPRRFRFGLMADDVQTAGVLLETARAAEAAGCSTLLIRDHFVEPPFGSQLGPIAALAAVAAATSSLRIGTLVCCNDYRHPVLLAQEAATLDVLSGGRFELGLGAGFHREEYGRAGIRFDAPGERVGRLEESLRVLKGLFGDGAFSFTGRHYTIDGLDGFPKPVQRPHPPIHVAGAGPRLLGIAAREAEGINLMGVDTRSGTVVDDPGARLAGAIEARVERIRRAAGDRFDHLELSTFVTPVLACDRGRTAEDLARGRGWVNVTAEQVLEMPTVLVGDHDGMAEELHARRERFGLSYFMLPRSSLERAAPLVARLTGV